MEPACSRPRTNFVLNVRRNREEEKIVLATHRRNSRGPGGNKKNLVHEGLSNGGEGTKLLLIVVSDTTCSSLFDLMEE